MQLRQPQIVQLRMGIAIIYARKVRTVWKEHVAVSRDTVSKVTPELVALLVRIVKCLQGSACVSPSEDVHVLGAQMVTYFLSMPFWN